MMHILAYSKAAADITAELDCCVLTRYSSVGSITAHANLRTQASSYKYGKTQVQQQKLLPHSATSAQPKALPNNLSLSTCTCRAKLHVVKVSLLGNTFDYVLIAGQHMVDSPVQARTHP